MDPHPPKFAPLCISPTHGLRQNPASGLNPLPWSAGAVRGVAIAGRTRATRGRSLRVSARLCPSMGRKAALQAEKLRPGALEFPAFSLLAGSIWGHRRRGCPVRPGVDFGVVHGVRCRSMAIVAGLLRCLRVGPEVWAWGLQLMRRSARRTGRKQPAPRWGYVGGTTIRRT